MCIQYNKLTEKQKKLFKNTTVKLGSATISFYKRNSEECSIFLEGELDDTIVDMNSLKKLENAIKCVKKQDFYSVYF